MSKFNPDWYLTAGGGVEGSLKNELEELLALNRTAVLDDVGQAMMTVKIFNQSLMEKDTTKVEQKLNLSAEIDVLNRMINWVEAEKKRRA